MKKIFKFGKIDFRGIGNPCNAVEITAELNTNAEGLPIFSASGMVWNASKTDCVMGGQCLEDLKQYIKNNSLFDLLLKLWRKYHLNDMHPECKHQRQLGWQQKAQETIKIYKYRLTTEASTERDKLKNKILEKAKNGEPIRTTPKEQEILKLNYFYETHKKDLGELAKYYELKETEEKAKGWTTPEEHPEGILTAECPVCGYKYGTAWKYAEIEPKDLETIKILLGASENE